MHHTSAIREWEVCLPMIGLAQFIGESYLNMFGYARLYVEWRTHTVYSASTFIHTMCKNLPINAMETYTVEHLLGRNHDLANKC